MNKKPATQESIERVIDITENAILSYEELLKNLENERKSIYLAPHQFEGVRELLYFLYELLIGSVVCMYEECSALKNLLGTESIYEKRYHMQLINLNQYEWCKYLLGRDNKGVFALIDNFFNESGNLEFMNKLQCLKKSITELGDMCNVKLRNITSHYDKPKRMYNQMVMLDSEDEYLDKLSYQMIIFEEIFLFVNSVIYYFISNKLVNYTHNQQRNKMFDFNPVSIVNGLIAKEIANESDVMSTVSTVLCGAWEKIESSRVLVKQLDLGVCLLAKKGSDTGELNDLMPIVEIKWAVDFMRFDIACSVKAYLNACTEMERSVLLRRVHIIEIAALTHLYGYSEKEQSCSIWNKIKQSRFFPNNPLSDELERNIIAFMSSTDKELKNLYIHYREDEQLNISSRLNAYNEMLHFEELLKHHKLILLCNKLDAFILSMMYNVQKYQDDKWSEILKPIYQVKEMAVKNKNEELVSLCEQILSLVGSHVFS